MIARFVLDETSWSAAAQHPDTLADAVTTLADLVELSRRDEARRDHEAVVKHQDFYETDVGAGVKLFAVLFEPDAPLRLEHDVRERLMRVLDQVQSFDDDDLASYDATFDGKGWLAPGIAWAHAKRAVGHAVGVLPLPLDGGPKGQLDVVVEGIQHSLHFIVDSPGRKSFFRDALTVENADEDGFQALAPSAFPQLEWADDLWGGLKDFSQDYFAIRSDLVRALGALDDHGARTYDALRSGDPRRLAAELSIVIGFETSDENGAAKQHGPSRRDRTRTHGGTAKVFWWHVKLKPRIDRVHFLHEAPVTELPDDHGLIVVGIFKDHCILPGDA